MALKCGDCNSNVFCQFSHEIFYLVPPFYVLKVCMRVKESENKKESSTALEV